MAELNHILCIDDEEDILEVAKLCFETMSDYRVTCLSSGSAAVEKAASIAPDLILVDVMMPEMDGPATLKRLKQIPALAQTPMVFMTARVQPQEIAEYLAMGASGVIPKPFDPMTLCEQIQKIWDKHHA